MKPDTGFCDTKRDYGHLFMGFALADVCLWLSPPKYPSTFAGAAVVFGIIGFVLLVKARRGAR